MLGDKFTKIKYFNFLAISFIILSSFGCSALKNGGSNGIVPKKSLGLIPGEPTDLSTKSNNISNPQSTNLSQNQNNSAININGQWEIGFLLQDKTYRSKIDLTQNGNSFSGQGSDEETNQSFNIINGVINPDNSVCFVKQYGDPNSPPVNYTGKLEMENDQNYQGPYLSGEYSATNSSNQTISGIWQAQMLNPPKIEQPPQASQATQSPNQSSAESQKESKTVEINPDHPPDLSGKWNAGYEYDFKTIHTTLFLEQYNSSLKGHGLDTSTNEAFDVEKGWYYFPRVTLVWKYTKGKGASSTRTMTVKANVSMINEKDYQGPYLNGKTQGGGAFEAQLVK